MKAPAFSLLADNGETISLDQFKGQNLVIFFYPKDDTPGCTKESCGFSENLTQFKKLNTAVLGVSRDSIASHQKFKSKFNLAFPLLSDSEETMCKAYEVLGEKMNYGKTYIGVIRSTFLIDEEGNIAHSWRNVKVDGHVDEVLKFCLQ